MTNFEVCNCGSESVPADQNISDVRYNCDAYFEVSESREQNRGLGKINELMEEDETSSETRDAMAYYSQFNDFEQGLMLPSLGTSTPRKREAGWLPEDGAGSVEGDFVGSSLQDLVDSQVTADSINSVDSDASSWCSDSNRRYDADVCCRVAAVASSSLSSPSEGSNIRLTISDRLFLRENRPSTKPSESETKHRHCSSEMFTDAITANDVDFYSAAEFVSVTEESLISEPRGNESPVTGTELFALKSEASATDAIVECSDSGIGRSVSCSQLLESACIVDDYDQLVTMDVAVPDSLNTSACVVYSEEVDQDVNELAVSYELDALTAYAAKPSIVCDSIDDGMLLSVTDATHMLSNSANVMALSEVVTEESLLPASTWQRICLSTSVSPSVSKSTSSAVVDASPGHGPAARSSTSSAIVDISPGCGPAARSSTSCAFLDTSPGCGPAVSTAISSAVVDTSPECGPAVSTAISSAVVDPSPGCGPAVSTSISSAVVDTSPGCGPAVSTPTSSAIVDTSPGGGPAPEPVSLGVTYANNCFVGDEPHVPVQSQQCDNSTCIVTSFYNLTSFSSTESSQNSASASAVCSESCETRPTKPNSFPRNSKRTPSLSYEKIVKVEQMIKKKYNTERHRGKDAPIPFNPSIVLRLQYTKLLFLSDWGLEQLQQHQNPLGPNFSAFSWSSMYELCPFYFNTKPSHFFNSRLGSPSQPNCSSSTTPSSLSASASAASRAGGAAPATLDACGASAAPELQAQTPGTASRHCTITPANSHWWQSSRTRESLTASLTRFRTLYQQQLANGGEHGSGTVRFTTV